MSEAPKRVWLVPDNSDCSDPAWNEATQYAIDSGKAKLFVSAAAIRALAMAIRQESHGEVPEGTPPAIPEILIGLRCFADKLEKLLEGE